jgi:hypothetical protein
MFEPCKGSAEQIADMISLEIESYAKTVCEGSLYVGQILGALSIVQAHFSADLIKAREKSDPESSHE